MSNILSPIVLFVYNRPDHTRNTLKSLSNADYASDSILYIYSDGPKENATNEEIKKIEDVRLIIRSEKWTSHVNVIESLTNKGLAESIITGVTDVIEKHGRVIVLEDDLIVTKGFLKYCNEALSIYEDDEKVMHVSASIYNAKINCTNNTLFLKALSCHGWATWKRAWKKYNNDALDHLAYFQSDKKRANLFDIDGSAYFMKQLEKNVSGELKSWAVRWYASWLREGGITLFPKYSLVQNSGFDGSGTNCKVIKNYLREVKDYIEVKKIEINEDEENRFAVSDFWKSYLSKNINEKNKKQNKIYKYIKYTDSVITKVIKRILIKYVPELKELLLSNGKMSWGDVVTYVKGSHIHESVKLYHPVKIRWCTIGEKTYVSRNAIMSYTEVGKYCSIGPGIKCGWGIHPTNGISTSPSFYSANPANKDEICKESKIIERKKITIGNDVFIGMNVTILDGINVGDGAIIGAGCIVSKDVPPYAIVVGSPMRIIRYRFDEEIIKKMLKRKWWNDTDIAKINVEKYFYEIDKFLID